jgi:hypothetical protein
MGKTQIQTTKEKQVIRCELFNHRSRQVVCLVEMDEELLDPAKDLIDPESMTFKHIKYGNQFTLVPIDDHRVATLNRVKEVYEHVTTKPASLFSTHIGRMDELIQAVGLLFGEIEYFQCTEKKHFEMLINPRSHDAELPPKAKYTVLGELLEKAKTDEQHPSIQDESESENTAEASSCCGGCDSPDSE